MTRKQIAIISSVVIGGVIAGGFISEFFKGEVKIVFVDDSSKDSNKARFTITNSFRRPIVYSLREEVEGARVRSGDHLAYEDDYHDKTFRYSNYTGKIAGKSAETIDVKVTVTNRWIMVVLYRDTWGTSSIGRMYAQLAHQASRARLHRVAGWLRPKSGFDRTSSPIMLANTPAKTPGK